MTRPEKGSDSLIRRIVVEYGHLYVYMYLTDENGKLIDEDRFRQPFRLDRKDASEEAQDGYHNMYQWVLDTTVFSASNGDSASDSKDSPPEE